MADCPDLIYCDTPGSPSPKESESREFPTQLSKELSSPRGGGVLGRVSEESERCTKDRPGSLRERRSSYLGSLKTEGLP